MHQLIYFHMSDSVNGSIIRKNVIRSSKQRCVVIHGTDDVTVEGNISCDTIGHCFVLKNRAEMENTFRGIGDYSCTAQTINIRSMQLCDGESGVKIASPNHV